MKNNTFNLLVLIFLPVIIFVGIFVCIWEEINFWIGRIQLKKEYKMGTISLKRGKIYTIGKE